MENIENLKIISDILLILFAISLIYIGVVTRLYTYITVLSFQGILLFGIALVKLNEINIINLIFILTETIVFKTIVIPIFMRRVIKRNKITREAEPFVSNFISVFVITSIILFSFILSNTIKDENLQKIFFVVALSALFTGLYIIASRKKVITHVMGYLIIENGVFILSIAVGSEMPMLINTGILLDIFISVLILGIFVNKIGDVIKEQDVDNLKILKDY
jgi:hydrogenase-4 component E